MRRTVVKQVEDASREVEDGRCKTQWQWRVRLNLVLGKWHHKSGGDDDDRMRGNGDDDDRTAESLGWSGVEQAASLPVLLSNAWGERDEKYPSLAGDSLSLRSALRFRYAPLTKLVVATDDRIEAQWMHVPACCTTPSRRQPVRPLPPWHKRRRCRNCACCSADSAS